MRYISHCIVLLAVVAVLMSRQAAHHPHALVQKPLSLQEVLDSRPIAPATNLLECARRADGGACVIVADSSFISRRLGPVVQPGDSSCESARGSASRKGGIVILGGGEGSGPLTPPAIIEESMFSCGHAAASAFAEAQMLPCDIDWFGLYDCYPVCFVRALEAVGLAPAGGGGGWVQAMYERTCSTYSPDELPVNTHGGLLAFGAPWEVPAMFNIIEACEQLNGEADGRQVPGARRALVYGNGGIFSHSAVAILAKSVD